MVPANSSTSVFSLRDAVLRHRGHTGGVDSLDEVHHLRQVCLGQLNALGVGDASVSRMAETRQRRCSEPGSVALP